MGDSHEEEVEEQGEGRLGDGCPILHASTLPIFHPSNLLYLPHLLKKADPVSAQDFGYICLTVSASQ